MSKDIIVLTPNGRRQKIHCTPDTSILQVLEDVCRKQGFQPSDYDLKHHNQLLDLTTTVRFSNIPNKAMLEMVEAERKRLETIVTIGLLLEDGERRTADFPPNTCLFDLITSLAPSELNALQQPTIMYMRQEVSGLTALREKTLRQLGLIKGRAILRLLNKAEEARQANISSVYRKSIPENISGKHSDNQHPENLSPVSGQAESSKKINKPLDPLQILKNEHKTHTQPEPLTIMETDIEEIKEDPMDTNVQGENHDLPQIQRNKIEPKSSTTSSFSQEILERRLRIEEEVTFLGTQKAIAFMQPEDTEDELEDLPDEFYELTIEEVRKLYHNLQQQRINLENTPLITSSKRDELMKQTSQQKFDSYKNVVVRIQFPDHIILQGIFKPANTIQDVNNFIKEHLQNPDRRFHIFTTPIKETLDPKMTLLEAKFVPCVLMHFKWIDDDTTEKYLKDEIYLKKTSSDAASILASKYRAPNRRKIDEQPNSTESNATPSTSKSSKVPKWFK